MLKPLALAAAFAAAAGALFATNAPRPKAGPDLAPPGSREPVLVELYQSQGCSSCPPANANLNAIADRPDVVALSFAVTYWDYLGWKDTFGSPQFTARQWDYAHHNGRGTVATPQIWIGGRRAIVGDNPRELAAAIASSRARGPTLAISGNEVRIGASAAQTGGADLWVARYDPHTLQVPVKAGENGGRTLPHKNVVRELVRIGHWDGGPKRFAIPTAPRGLATAAFLQAGKGGPILGAAKGG